MAPFWAWLLRVSAIKTGPQPMRDFMSATAFLAISGIVSAAERRAVPQQVEHPLGQRHPHAELFSPRAMGRFPSDRLARDCRWDRPPIRKAVAKPRYRDGPMPMSEDKNTRCCCCPKSYGSARKLGQRKLAAPQRKKPGVIGQRKREGRQKD